jgi:hypothetical protein
MVSDRVTKNGCYRLVVAAVGLIGLHSMTPEAIAQRFRPETFFDSQQQIRYRLIDNGNGGSVRWSQANNFAIVRGSALVAIGDGVQNAFVAEIARQIGRELWIGLSAPCGNGTPGAYSWSSVPLVGNPFYRNWNAGEPNDSENCNGDVCDRYALMTLSNGAWNNTVDNPGSCYGATFWGVEASPCTNQVTQQTGSVSICASGLASYSVSASGSALTFQWQWQPDGPNTAWAALNDGVNTNSQGTPAFEVSGATMPSVNITSMSGAVGPVGNFRCVISNACGSVTSDEATLTILDASDPTCSPCNYDFNQDENVDLLDAQQMAQVFVGLITPESTWLDGDLNGDENADLTDAQLLAAFVVTGVCPI